MVTVLLNLHCDKKYRQLVTVLRHKTTETNKQQKVEVFKQN